MATATEHRHAQMLRTALGCLLPLLQHPDITEIMVNADGQVWVAVAGQGMRRTKYCMDASNRYRLIRLLASQAHIDVTPENPSLATRLPEWGARVQAAIPPYSVDGPTLTLRLPARTIYTLDDYVQQQRLSAEVVAQLRVSLAQRDNIVIAGGTGSGKTTLVNALLHELRHTQERLILIEDTLELQCQVPNLIRRLVNPPETTLSKAIFDALRENPDRIIVGEVRDQSAYDLINIWNTGHPGNICTVHASSAEDALHRLNRLAQQIQPTMDFMPEIRRMVGLVVFLACTS